MGPLNAPATAPAIVLLSVFFRDRGRMPSGARVMGRSGAAAPPLGLTAKHNQAWVNAGGS